MRGSHHNIPRILNNVPPGFSAIRLIGENPKSKQRTLLTKLDQITIVQGRLSRLPIIDKEGVPVGQIAQSRNMTLKSQLGMERSHLSIACGIKAHIAIGSCSKTKGISLEILSLSPATASQVVQHELHSDALLPLIGEMGKKHGKEYEKGFQAMPVS
jgi:hypothetical protein